MFIAEILCRLLKGALPHAPAAPKKPVPVPAGGVYVDVAGGKIRRNGPCPCGEPVKFKHCHLPRIRAGEFSYLKPPQTVVTGRQTTKLGE